MPSTDTPPGAAILTGADLHLEPGHESLAAMRLLKPREVAALLNCSEGALAIMRSRSTPDTPKGPPFVRIGRSVRYVALDVQRFLAGARRTGTRD